jgi:O-antigen/teichoic acid export membrane protein
MNSSQEEGQPQHMHRPGFIEKGRHRPVSLLQEADDIAIDTSPTQGRIQAVKTRMMWKEYELQNDWLWYETPTWILPVIPGKNVARKSEEVKGTGVFGPEGQFIILRDLVKSSGIYALASLASPLISLVLAPFLTHHLSPSDYGALAVLNTAIALLAGITQMGLGSAFFRSYSYDYESLEDRRAVLSMVVILLMLFSLPVAFIMMLAASALASFLFNTPSLSDGVRLAGLVMLAQNLTVPGFAWLRAESRAAFFSCLSIANLLVSLVANIILVGILHMGIVGALMATGGGYAIVGLCTLPIIILRAGLRLRFDVAQGLLSFGLPNVSTFVSVWILQLSDRLLLGRLGSLSQTASYSVAYSLGGIVSVIVLSPFTLAWPSAMYSIAKRKNAAHTFQLVFRWYGIVLLVATFGLSLVSTLVLNLFFPSGYHSAAPIIPIIALSTMFYGIYNMFTTGISIRRKTWFAFLFTTISALTNVGLNLILIPLYGPMGAALSTLLAYMLLAVVAYIVNQRIYPIPYEIGFFSGALLIGITFYTASSLLAQAQEFYLTAAIFLGSLVCYAGCLAFLGIWLTRHHRETQIS